MTFEMGDKNAEEPKKPKQQKNVKDAKEALADSEEAPARRPRPNTAEFLFMMIFAFGSMGAIYYAILTHTGPADLYSSSPLSGMKLGN